VGERFALREPTSMRVERLGSEHMAGFRALFEATGSGCFCRFWHHRGTKNEWLDRCAHRPEENLAEQEAAVSARDPSGEGLVALDDDGRVVGWMKVAPRDAMPKLTSLPVYRTIAAHAAGGAATWSIGCFLVHPERRRHGVARALLTAAEAHVLAQGGAVLEGHPRRSSAPLYDEEAWQGPESMFVAAGFVEVAADEAAGGVAPYPLYRKVLAPPVT